MLKKWLSQNFDWMGLKNYYYSECHFLWFIHSFIASAINLAIAGAR